MRNILAIAALSALALGGCKKSDGGPDNEKNTDNTGAKVTSTMSPTATPAEPSSEVPITSKSPDAVALFKQARDLRENHRMAAARDKLSKAVELDPEFAQAHALLAKSLPHEQGKAHLERAGELAADLPETERLLITAMVADGDEAVAALKGLADKAGGDWRVQMMVARHNLYTGEIDRAQVAFEKATKLNPAAPYPHNNLAYIYAEKGDFDAAIASANRYAELVPGEPNPLDTKAEILMLAGKFDKAEAAFREALKLAPEFTIAHEGIAATMFHRDNWDGGLVEMQKAVDGASGVEKTKMANKLAWAYVACNKNSEADKTFAAVADMHVAAGSKPSPGMDKIREAEVAMHHEDYKAAAKLATTGVSALASEGMPAKKQRWGKAIAAIALARAGQVDKAKTQLAELAEGGSDHYVHYAAGHVELAAGNPEAAIAALDKLEHDKWFSRRAALVTAEAFEKAGKTEKAKAIRASLASQYHRDIDSIIIRTKAEKAGSS